MRLDTTLEREVAIKVLPDAFTTDRDRLARIEREAKLLASLNHPNIAGVYGLHQAEGLRFLAMEWVPGEDLAERLERGALLIDEREAGPGRHDQGPGLRPGQGTRAGRRERDPVGHGESHEQARG